MTAMAREQPGDLSPRRAELLRVLLVEDSSADAELTVEALEEVLPSLAVRHVTTLARALRATCEDDFDIALVDLSLPDAEGLQALRALRSAAPDLALVVLTGLDEDGIAQQALVGGAQDYLVKGHLSGELLGRALRYALSRAQADVEARRSRAWAQSVLDSIEAPTCAVDASGLVVAVNAAWTRFTVDNGGSPEHCGVGADYLAVCDRSGDPAVEAVADQLRALLVTGRGRVELEYACHSPTEQRWFSLRATPAASGDAAVITHLDVTALRTAHDELDHAATHDPLTGLANRRGLLADLSRRLRTLVPGRAVAVAFVDLDRFKLVNDKHGHTAGDGVLVRVGAELTAAVREVDLVARHGGDEFVVVLDATEGELPAIAARLHDATSQVLHLEDADVAVSASIGMVLSHAGAGDTAEELLRAVDDAMHSAKALGRGRVEVYTDELRERAAARAQLYSELTVAVEQDQFVLHFQPIVVPDVGGVHAVEALVRWEHPVRGLLQPGDFLDVAEQTGLIVPIGVRVIEAACHQGKRLHDEGLHLSVTVNLSAKQLGDPRTEQVIARALADSGFPAHALIVEVTETTMIDDTDVALASLQAVKALGVQVAVDDFGTGYSSMAYIKRYPVDGLKIDRTFVRDIVDDADDRAIVASLIRLARDLDLWVIAEGVETPQQLALLQDMGCDLVQGFLFARPLPAEALLGAAHLLSTRRQVSVPTPRPALETARPARTAAPPVVPDRVDVAVVRRMLAMRTEGMSLHTIAAALNAEALRTPQGARWSPSTVGRALAEGVVRAAGGKR